MSLPTPPHSLSFPFIVPLFCIQFQFPDHVLIYFPLLPSEYLEEHSVVLELGAPCLSLLTAVIILGCLNVFISFGFHPTFSLTQINSMASQIELV